MLKRAVFDVIGPRNGPGARRSGRRRRSRRRQDGPRLRLPLVRPSNWNGILLLYAHGYVSKDVPVGITPDDQLVISLLASQGFAVAVSSFSENGWVLKDGTQRTHQLLGLFTSKFGKPARVYAAGASMGGLIAIRLIETWPDEFAGVLPACAVAGGLARQVRLQR